MSESAFERYYAAGYHDLIPIIPHDAHLSPYTKVDPADRGKSPGVLYPSGWGGFDWLKAVADADSRAQWATAGAGLGLVCRQLVAIDIDVLDEDAAAYVLRHAVERFGSAPLRIGRAPKKLLVYRLDASDDAHSQGGVAWRRVRFRLPDGSEHAVEVLGRGRQFVAEGIHPKTGRRYTWPCPLPELDALPVVREQAVVDWLDELAGDVAFMLDADVLESQTQASAEREGVDQDALKADDLDVLEQACAHIPNTTELFPAREDYIRMGCAFRAAFADDPGRGFAAWWRWCEQWEGGNDPVEAAGDWERMYPPFGLGARYLFELARQHGGYSNAAEVFAEYADEEAEAEADTDGGEPQSGVEFFDRYVFVEELQRFADLRTGHLLSKEQFSDRWAGTIGEGGTGRKSAAMVYLNHPKRRMVWGVTYRPLQGLFVQEQDHVCANTWRPGPAHSDWLGDEAPADDAIQPWLRLLETLVPNETERGHLLDWMAYQLQTPGVKCNWHPLIVGDEGIGKDSLFVPLLRGLGRNATTVQAEQIQGQWTGWAHGHSLVVVEEINTFERRALADRLKPLLSNPPECIEINDKYIRPYSIPNIINAVFFSNHADAVAISRTDRRFFVVRSPVDPADLDPADFARLYQWYYGGGDRSVCAWLRARDLSAFNPQGKAPWTAAKADMHDLTLSVVESALLTAIDEGETLFQRDLLLLSEIEDHLRQTVPPAQLGRISKHRLGNILRSLGVVRLDKKLRIDSRSQWVWAVRRTDTYLKMARDGDPAALARLFLEQRGRAGERGARRVFDDEAGAV